MGCFEAVFGRTNGSFGFERYFVAAAYYLLRIANLLARPA